MATVAFSSIISAPISRIIRVNIMWIVVMVDDISSNYVLGIGAGLLSSCPNARTTVLFIVVVRVSITTLIATSSSNILIILNHWALCHIMVIIEALPNILNLSRLKRATLVFLVCWSWLFL